MNRADILNYRRLAWQLRQTHFEAKFTGLLNNDEPAVTAAEAQLKRIDVLEDALNNIESAITQREFWDSQPDPE